MISVHALHEIIYALEQTYRGSELIATVSVYTPSPLAHWAQAQPTLLVHYITCCAAPYLGSQPCLHVPIAIFCHQFDLVVIKLNQEGTS